MGGSCTSGLAKGDDERSRNRKGGISKLLTIRLWAHGDITLHALPGLVSCRRTIASPSELTNDDKSCTNNWAGFSGSDEVNGVSGESEDNYAIEFVGVCRNFDPFGSDPDYNRWLRVAVLEVVDETSERADGIVIRVPFLP